MSELFLERSAEVLDDWEAVRDDAAWSDAMRWEPDREPRRAASAFEPGNPMGPVIRHLYVRQPPQRVPAVPGSVIRQGGGLVFPRGMPVQQAFLRVAVEANVGPFVLAMRQMVEQLRRVAPSLAAVVAAFQRPVPAHDRHHPPPWPGGAEYHRRRRARARRRR